MSDSTAVAVFNGLEAALWITLGIGTFLARNVRGLTPPVRWRLTLAYIAFGISDLIEIRTGAWWNPPSLLVFKGLCLMFIASGLRSLWRAYHPKPADEDEDEPQKANPQSLRQRLLDAKQTLTEQPPTSSPQ